jgi:hypothetical protein
MKIESDKMIGNEYGIKNGWLKFLLFLSFPLFISDICISYPSISWWNGCLKPNR